MEFLRFVLLLLFALAFDGDDPYIESDSDVLFLHRRQLGTDQVLFVRLADVRGRRPLELALAIVDRQSRPARAGGHQTVEEAIDIRKRFPTYEAHDVLPIN